MTNTKGRLLFIVFFLCSFSSSSFAKLFASQYCEFSLPDNWNCKLEGSEYVCQSENDNKKKEAIIILTAKMAGPKDSIEDYLAYLKSTKTFKLPGGKTQVSEPKYAGTKIIQDGQNWVDAMHLASEVPGFYTRYLATVKEDLGIAVTFSVAKDFYADYSELFDNIIKTLKVFKQNKTKSSNFTANSNGISVTGIEENAQTGSILPTNSPKQGQKKADSEGMLILLLLIGALVFIIIKLKKKK